MCLPTRRPTVGCGSALIGRADRSCLEQARRVIEIVVSGAAAGELNSSLIGRADDGEMSLHLGGRSLQRLGDPGRISRRTLFRLLLVALIIVGILSILTTMTTYNAPWPI